MCESWGSTKPKDAMKVKVFLLVGLGRIPSFGGGRKTGPSQGHCSRGGARVHTLGPERW